MKEITVVFRRHRTGDCFALFPELPGDTAGVLCTGYAGQHSPPTTTTASPAATPPNPTSTPTCTTNWTTGIQPDRAWAATPRCTSVVFVWLPSGGAGRRRSSSGGPAT